MPRGTVDLRRASGRGSSYYRTQVIKPDPCVYCGGKSMSTDHIHPTSRGGMNSWINFAPTCIECNNAKASLSLLAFMLNRIGRCSRKQGMAIKGDSIAVMDEMPELWFDPLGILIKNGDDHGNPRL